METFLRMEKILKLGDWLVNRLRIEFCTKKRRIRRKSRCRSKEEMHSSRFFSRSEDPRFRAALQSRKKKKGVLFGCWLMCGDTCRWGRETAQGVAKWYRKLPSAGSLPASASSSANDSRLTTCLMESSFFSRKMFIGGLSWQTSPGMWHIIAIKLHWLTIFCYYNSLCNGGILLYNRGWIPFM